MMKLKLTLKKKLTIDELLGLAVGQLGMGVDTFDTLTPDEFAAIMAKHNEYLDAKMRDEWERARIMATILIQPHITRKITPEKLLPLPWDKKRKNEKTKTPEVSRKEHLQRFRDIKRRLNGG